MNRKSHQRCFIWKDVIKNFAKVSRKHLCQDLFFTKVAGKKDFLVRLVKFAKFLRTPFFTEHPRVTASTLTASMIIKFTSWLSLKLIYTGRLIFFLQIIFVEGENCLTDISTSIIYSRKMKYGEIIFSSIYPQAL